MSFGIVLRLSVLFLRCIGEKRKGDRSELAYNSSNRIDFACNIGGRKERTCKNNIVVYFFLFERSDYAFCSSAGV